MIGIFDSGVGALTALSEVRRLFPKENILCLCDRKNAPYGTKRREELLLCVKRNIAELKSLGAEKILIACCTASTLYPSLDEEERAVSVPIIYPAVREALRVTKNRRIGVIGTRATVRSRAFSEAISLLGDRVKTAECEAQALVGMIEGGARGDTPLSDADAETLLRILLPIRSFGADTLILGCTHFPHLERHVAELLPNTLLVNPSLEGAKELTKTKTAADEDGETVFL